MGYVEKCCSCAITHDAGAINSLPDHNGRRWMKHCIFMKLSLYCRLIQLRSGETDSDTLHRLHLRCDEMSFSWTNIMDHKVLNWVSQVQPTQQLTEWLTLAIGSLISFYVFLVHLLHKSAIVQRLSALSSSNFRALRIHANEFTFMDRDSTYFALSDFTCLWFDKKILEANGNIRGAMKIRLINNITFSFDCSCSITSHYVGWRPLITSSQRLLRHQVHRNAPIELEARSEQNEFHNFDFLAQRRSSDEPTSKGKFRNRLFIFPDEFFLCRSREFEAKVWAEQKI